MFYSGSRKDLNIQSNQKNFTISYIKAAHLKFFFWARLSSAF